MIDATDMRYSRISGLGFLDRILAGFGQVVACKEGKNADCVLVSVSGVVELFLACKDSRAYWS